MNCRLQEGNLGAPKSWALPWDCVTAGKAFDPRCASAPRPETWNTEPLPAREGFSCALYFVWPTPTQTPGANWLLDCSLFLSLLVLVIAQGQKMHFLSAERSRYVPNTIHYYSLLVRWKKGWICNSLAAFYPFLMSVRENILQNHNRLLFLWFIYAFLESFPVWLGKTAKLGEQEEIAKQSKVSFKKKKKKGKRVLSWIAFQSAKMNNLFLHCHELDILPGHLLSQGRKNCLPLRQSCLIPLHFNLGSLAGHKRFVLMF